MPARLEKETGREHTPMTDMAASIALLEGLEPQVAASLLKQAQRRKVEADEVIFRTKLSVSFKYEGGG